MAKSMYKIRKLSVKFKRADQPFFHQVNMENNSIEQVCAQSEGKEEVGRWGGGEVGRWGGGEVGRWGGGEVGRWGGGGVGRWGGGEVA